MTVSLAVNSLCFGYNETAALASGVHLRFVAGSLVCLAGPNGSGKSTLLRTLAGLLPPLGGEVLLDGLLLSNLSARERARRLAVVFARFPGGSLLRGAEFVALGRSPHLGWLDVLSERDHIAVDEALRLVDAAHLADQLVDSLSDGERQRLAVARALAQEAGVVLLDEPTAFLDLPHRVNLYRSLRQLARSRGLCIVMSSHDLDLAMRFADRMVLLDGKGGVTEGVPETLALSGAVESAFATAGVRFDLESGGFAVEPETCAPICCLGDCLEAQWTRRALHRMGYELRGEVFPRIVVDLYEDACRWTVALAEGDERYVYNLDAALALLPR